MTENKGKRKSNRTGGQIDECQTPPYGLDPVMAAIRRLVVKSNMAEKIPVIWEPCAGSGILANALTQRLNNRDPYTRKPNALIGRAKIVATTKTDGPDFLVDSHDFLTWDPDFDFDLIVTNPPFSIKPKILKRCYELGRPFALLMPAEFYATSAAVRLFQQYGIGLVIPDQRINFKMPNIGWTGPENRDKMLDRWIAARTANWANHPTKKHWINDPKRRRQLESTPTTHFPSVWYCWGLGLEHYGLHYGPVNRRPYDQIQPDPGQMEGPFDSAWDPYKIQNIARDGQDRRK